MNTSSLEAHADSMAGTVQWMLSHVDRQIETFHHPDEVKKVTLLTPVRQEHIEAMNVIRTTLHRLEITLRSRDLTAAISHFQEAITLTTVADNIEDPRRYYWQTLAWYAAFAPIRDTEMSE